MRPLRRETAWIETTLGELVEFFDHKRIPLSGKERSERKGPFPYYGASGIIDHIDDYIFEGRYLLIAEDGENLRTRNTPIAFFGSGKFWVNNHAHIVRAKDGVADDYFLMSCIQASNISGFITGAAQPKLTQANLRLIPIRRPPLPTQQKIAVILSAYDDLIENNLRRIKILEEMAQNLYREWFVKFRFPGHQKVKMVDSPLGKIPEGWAVVKFGDKTAFQKGKKPQKVFTKATAGTIPHLLIDVLRGGTAEYCKQDSMVIVKEDDTLMVMDGSGSCDVFIGFSGAIGSTIGSYRSVEKSRLSPYALYLFLLDRQEELKTKNVGAAVPHANKEYINNMVIVIPPVEVNRKFDDQIRPLFRFRSVLQKKIIILRQTRDLLLPKLISGELDVSELDIAIPEANA